MPQSRLTRRDPVLMDYVPLTPATRRLSRVTLDVQLNDYQYGNRTDKRRT
jgi:hypothetical protein